MALDNVVDFPTEDEDMVWLCKCGCQTFFLHTGGRTECAQCGDTQEGPDGCWKPSPDAPIADRIGSETTVRHAQDSDFMRARLQDLVMDESVVAVVLIRENGGVQTSIFTEAETEEQQDWVRRRLKEAEGMLLDTHAMKK